MQHRGGVFDIPSPVQPSGVSSNIYRDLPAAPAFTSEIARVHGAVYDALPGQEPEDCKSRDSYYNLFYLNSSDLLWLQISCKVAYSLDNCKSCDKLIP